MWWINRASVSCGYSSCLIWSSRNAAALYGVMHADRDVGNATPITFVKFQPGNLRPDGRVQQLIVRSGHPGHMNQVAVV